MVEWGTFQETVLLKKLVFGFGVVVACAASADVFATEVALAGLFGQKAVLVINGGAPQTLSVGQKTDEGVRLLAVEGELAVVEVNARRERLRLGERVVQRIAAGGTDSIYLEADGQGHFLTTGNVNGASVRFLVDTGATFVSIGMSDARRMGIDVSDGVPGVSQTANGVSRIWRVRLDTLKVGDVVVHGVDAAVHANDLPVALLGMSFLNRMEMTREGTRLVLKKRY